MKTKMMKLLCTLLLFTQMGCGKISNIVFTEGGESNIDAVTGMTISSVKIVQIGQVSALSSDAIVESSSLNSNGNNIATNVYNLDTSSYTVLDLESGLELKKNSTLNLGILVNGILEGNQCDVLVSGQRQGTTKTISITVSDSCQLDNTQIGAIAGNVSFESSNESAVAFGQGIIEVIDLANSPVTLKATYSGVESEFNVTTQGNYITKITTVGPTGFVGTAPLGTEWQFSAVATLFDGSTEDITSSVVWSVDDSGGGVGAITTGAKLSVTGVGDIQVIATHRNFSNSGADINAHIVDVEITSALLISIAISKTSNNSELPIGLTEQYEAIGTYSDGTTVDITNHGSINWISSDTAIATINSTGLATGVASGTVDIGANMVNADGDTIQGVLSSVSVINATLISILIDEAPAITATTIPLGVVRNFSATGTYNDSLGNPTILIDITDHVTWVSSDAAVASFSATVGEEGELTALTLGPTTLSATLGAVTSNTISYTVTAAELISFVIVQANTSVAKGLSFAFTALGTYSDGTTADITNTVGWTSSNTAVAQINPSAGTSINLNLQTVGTTTITATGVVYPNAQTSTKTRTLTVTAAQLMAVEITPDPAPDTAKGYTRQFTAMGKFTDDAGFDTDITTNTYTTWTSSSPTIADFQDAVNFKGRISTLLVGTTNVNVTWSGPTHSSYSAPANISFEVTAAELTDIRIETDATETKSNFRAPRGTTYKLKAEADFSDGTIVDVTAHADLVWSHDDANIATVSNAGGTEGHVLAVDSGLVTDGAASVSNDITATFTNADMTTNSDTITFDVLPHVLQTISVTSANTNIPNGDQETFSTTYAYSDGRATNLGFGVSAPNISWSSDKPASMSIVTATGVATALDEENTIEITATDSISGISGSKVVNVVPSVSSIAVVCDDTSLRKTTAGLYNTTWVTEITKTTCTATVTYSDLTTGTPTLTSWNVGANLGGVVNVTGATANPIEIYTTAGANATTSLTASLSGVTSPAETITSLAAAIDWVDMNGYNSIPIGSISSYQDIVLETESTDDVDAVLDVDLAAVSDDSACIDLATAPDGTSLRLTCNCDVASAVLTVTYSGKTASFSRPNPVVNTFSCTTGGSSLNFAYKKDLNTDWMDEYLVENENHNNVEKDMYVKVDSEFERIFYSPLFLWMLEPKETTYYKLNAIVSNVNS